MLKLNKKKKQKLVTVFLASHPFRNIIIMTFFFISFKLVIYFYRFFHFVLSIKFSFYVLIIFLLYFNPIWIDLGKLFFPANMKRINITHLINIFYFRSVFGIVRNQLTLINYNTYICGGSGKYPVLLLGNYIIFCLNTVYSG